jgi:hypothetical protein
VCKTQLYLLSADQFEQERDELLAAVDRCAVHRDYVNRLEWENRKRADEVKELQKVRLSLHQQGQWEGALPTTTTTAPACKQLAVGMSNSAAT